MEELIEKAEKTAEETQKTYTEDEFKKQLQAELDKILPSKIERAKAKAKREYESRVNEAEGLLMASVGATTYEDARTKLTDLLSRKGVSVPQRAEPQYSERELNLIANADADDVIADGYAEISSEIERLNGKELSARDKIYFDRLTKAKYQIDEEKELASIGISKADIDNDDYRDFAKNLDSRLSTKQKYELFEKYRPKAEKVNIGSLNATPSAGSVYKEYYTPEEASKLTREDLKDPKIEEAVTRSMAKWK